MDALINIPNGDFKSQNNLQAIANNLDNEALEIMSRFALKNKENSSQLIKDLSQNFMTKKYF